MSKSKVPHGNSAFNNYVNSTGSYIQEGEPTNAERLLFTTTEKDFWLNTVTSWNREYALYSDELKSRTKEVIDNVNEIKNNFLDFIDQSMILKRIKANPEASDVDLDVFLLLPKSSGSTTSSDHAIEENVLPMISQIGGATLVVKCLSDDGNRCRIVEGASVVEYRYCIGCDKPENADSALLSYGVSTKASFQIKLPLDAAKKEVHIYFRWNNTRHQNIAGPWSDLNSVMVL